MAGFALDNVYGRGFLSTENVSNNMTAQCEDNAQTIKRLKSLKTVKVHKMSHT